MNRQEKIYKFLQELEDLFTNAEDHKEIPQLEDKLPDDEELLKMVADLKLRAERNKKQ